MLSLALCLTAAALGMAAALELTRGSGP